MWSYSTNKRQCNCQTKGSQCYIGQFTPSPGILFLSENPDVLFSHASIILIPFPPSTHPSDLLLFFHLAWTLDLWCEKPRRPGVRQEESPSVMGLNVLPTHTLWSGCLWRSVWTLRCGEQRRRPSNNNGPLYSDTSLERDSANDGHLPDLYTHKHECTHIRA